MKWDKTKWEKEREQLNRRKSTYIRSSIGFYTEFAFLFFLSFRSSSGLFPLDLSTRLLGDFGCMLILKMTQESQCTLYLPVGHERFTEKINNAIQRKYDRPSTYYLLCTLSTLRWVKKMKLEIGGFVWNSFRPERFDQGPDRIFWNENHSIMKS